MEERGRRGLDSTGLAPPAGRTPGGGWDLTDAEVSEVMSASFGSPQDDLPGEPTLKPGFEVPADVEPTRYARGIVPLSTAQSFAEGGLVKGPDGSDSVPIQVTPGEEITWQGVTPEGEPIKVIDTGEGPPHVLGDDPGVEGDQWDKFFAGTPASMQPEPEIPDTRSLAERLRPVPGRLWDKFLVQRRDGSVPHWPYLVIGARDPAAPAALRAYADTAASLGMNEEYCADIWRLADSFEEYRRVYGNGDPDADPHRPENPEVVAKIRAGSTPDGWKLRRFDDVPDVDPWPAEPDEKYPF